MKIGRIVYCSAIAVALIIGVGLWKPMAKANDNGYGNQVPQFRVDASWPKALPAPVGTDGVAHTWVQGEVAGTCIDRNDNVFTFNRAWEVGADYNGVLQGNESGAINGNDATPSAIPSPPVVEFDSDGNVIAGWGNPSIYLTPTTGTTPANTGYSSYMAYGAHGCFVDYEGNLWVGGNGDGIVQKYNPHTAAAEGAAATYELQLGQKATCDGVQTTTNPFSSCGGVDYNNSHTLLNEPADIAVDPGPDSQGHVGDVYVADGYGNHRIVVFDSNGNYLWQWGTQCTTNSQNCPPGYFGSSGGGHPHCVVLGNDGMVYVCDRPNSRIQVFDKRACSGPAFVATPWSSASSPGTQPVCLPKRIINIGNNVGDVAIGYGGPGGSVGPGLPISGFPTASPVQAATLLLQGTRACDIDLYPNIDFLGSQSPTSQKYIVDADLANDNEWVLDKATGLVFGALGQCGLASCPGHNAAHFAYSHTTASDSRGNVYVAETITGRRIQKFVPVDEFRQW